MRRGKLLKKELPRLQFSLARCHDLVSKMYGFSHLSDIFVHIGLVERSPGDEDVDQPTFERRFWHQVDVLYDAGISQYDAEKIVDAVRPTGEFTVQGGVRAIEPEFIQAYPQRIDH